jgi:hypothetical protein
MTENKSEKGQSGDQKGQGDTGDKAGQKGEDDQQRNEDGFTPEQQEKVNALVAEERRKEAKKAAVLKKELESLKGKKEDGDGTKQDDSRISSLEEKLKKYEAKDLADKICADLKIPKEEREKYVRHVTATDEDEIREQIRALKQDFAPKKTGAGSNPAKTGKPGKNDGINQFIRNRGRTTS